jgi:hypothetical protein
MSVAVGETNRLSFGQQVYALGLKFVPSVESFDSSRRCVHERQSLGLDPHARSRGEQVWIPIW